MKTNVIEITVAGRTQTGKSCVMAEIKNALESRNVAVVYLDRSFRNNPPSSFSDSAEHEKPCADRTVIVLQEENEPDESSIEVMNIDSLKAAVRDLLLQIESADGTTQINTRLAKEVLNLTGN